jgi:N-acetyl-gamma-glutamyl-phosphate reductase
MIKAGIVGATGFTGSELVRLLHVHPEVSIELITSESKEGNSFSDIHPHFTKIEEQILRPADVIPEHELDVLFLALPHGVSMDYVKKYGKGKYKIIDLSGDFRLSTPAIYEHWYDKEHNYPSGFEQAVYGLPEINREQIKKSQLVANPGCYPTSSILGLAPLVASHSIETDRIIIDAKSGVTGAGIKAKTTNLYSNVSDNFKAYALKTHRHTIEIEEQLNELGQEVELSVQFTPHLLPVDRGILSTIYARPKTEKAKKEENLYEMFREFYEGHPFVRIRRQPSSLKEVRGSNFCDLYVTYDQRTDQIIVLSVIDNLVKGASGQAVHNMNLQFDLPETMGLEIVPLNP